MSNWYWKLKRMFSMLVLSSTVTVDKKMIFVRTMCTYPVSQVHRVVFLMNKNHFYFREVKKTHHESISNSYDLHDGHHWDPEYHFSHVSTHTNFVFYKRSYKKTGWFWNGSLLFNPQYLSQIFIKPRAVLESLGRADFKTILVGCI